MQKIKEKRQHPILAWKTRNGKKNTGGGDHRDVHYHDWSTKLGNRDYNGENSSLLSNNSIYIIYIYIYIYIYIRYESWLYILYREKRESCVFVSSHLFIYIYIYIYIYTHKIECENNAYKFKVWTLTSMHILDGN